MLKKFPLNHHTLNEYAGDARDIARRIQWHVETGLIEHSTHMNYSGMAGKVGGLMIEILLMILKNQHVTE
jgi:hypothetical protein